MNEELVLKYFKIGDVLLTRTKRATFEIVDINNNSIKIKPTAGKTISKLSYDKLSVIFDNFSLVDDKKIEASVNKILSNNKLNETSTEVYLYGFVKEYRERSDADLIDDISKIYLSKNIKETEKSDNILIRLGQGSFRNNLLRYWNNKCSVTECNITSVLIASHIKPWKYCNNQERLDIYNGLLLIPNLDKLFDRGLISFDSEGKILISFLLNNVNLDILGINSNIFINVDKLEEKHKYYLEFHKQEIYKHLNK